MTTTKLFDSNGSEDYCEGLKSSQGFAVSALDKGQISIKNLGIKGSELFAVYYSRKLSSNSSSQPKRVVNDMFTIFKNISRRKLRNK